ITNILNNSNINSKQIIATSLILTNDHFGSADFLPGQSQQKAKRILTPIVKKGIVPVVTGFIGSTIDGKTTTLGRGGSDYTAAILGFCLSAEEIQIWTDVDGIFTSDPKFIKQAKVLSDVSYREASELAAFGAKVLHPRTIRPAVSSGIPVRVLNTFNPSAKGTVIRNRNKEKSHIVAIASKRKITLVTIYSTDMLLNKGFLARVFSIFSKYNISIDLVSVSEVSISASLDNDENLDKAIKELEQFATITTTRSLGMISLIGEKIVNVKNILKQIFSILDNSNIEVKMISLGATDINISLVLPSLEIDKSVNLLHNALIKKGEIL
ncbi:MAG: aspartate kinase, partial [Microgenomates group bacterium Gr01-1014_93]